MAAVSIFARYSMNLTLRRPSLAAQSKKGSRLWTKGNRADAWVRLEWASQDTLKPETAQKHCGDRNSASAGALARGPGISPSAHLRHPRRPLLAGNFRSVLYMFIGGRFCSGRILYTNL
jgi:hypothetical protein